MRTKGIFTFLIIFVIILISSIPGIVPAQSFTSPIHWHHAIFDSRVSALGQSTAALSNRSAYNINPAIPLEGGMLIITNYIPSTTAFDSPLQANGVKLYSPSVGYNLNRLSLSALIDHSSYSLKPEFGGGNYVNTLVRFQSGYQVNQYFSIGAGFIFSSYDSPIITIEDEKYMGPARAWGISIGGLFKNEWETSTFRFTPQIGLALNDISSGFNLVP